MESIIQFRQMMADQKFSEVQRLIEVQLTMNSTSRHELLSLYFESLKAQRKKNPEHLLLELAELESIQGNYEFASSLLSELTPAAQEFFFVRIHQLKTKSAMDKGQMDELYLHLTHFLIRQYEKQTPFIPTWATEASKKFFKHDFSLKLKEIALSLLQHNYLRVEVLTRELIISSFEKSTPRNLSEKLRMIGEILKTGQQKAQMEIYQNFCLISANGILEKSDYKRIVEMVIFFDDFKFQVLILNLMDQLKLRTEAVEYAHAVRENANYDYTYLDKFFSHLKKHFFQKSEKEVISPEVVLPDLVLREKIQREIFSPVLEIEDYEDEQRYFNLIKHQDYSSIELCELAVSFLQSEMPRVSLKASEKALLNAFDDKEFLKASYLKLTAQLLLKDYRAGLDTCLVAIGKAQTRDDVLSFLYGQAEIYIRLNQSKDAKNILSKILSIDSDYRLAKERLDKLNEI